MSDYVQYKFRCKNCDKFNYTLIEKGKPITTKKTCNACGGSLKPPMKEQVSDCPAIHIPPEFGGPGTLAERKAKKFGVKNLRTGEGLTKKLREI